MEPEFKIGLTASMTNLADLGTPVEAPRSAYLPYSKRVVLGDGSMRGLGFPQAAWTFPLLSLEERDQLKMFCPDESARVYIRTKRNDDTYGDYSGIMHWPEEEERWGAGMKQSMTIRFTMLEALA